MVHDATVSVCRWLASIDSRCRSGAWFYLVPVVAVDLACIFLSMVAMFSSQLVFMKRFIYVSLLLLLVACGDDQPPLPRLAGDAVILAFGDSLTEGYGVKTDESYPARLASISGRKVINAGISGEISAQGLRRLPKLLEKHNPDLVILCHGGNDFLRKLSMTDMIRMAKAQGAEVVLLGVPKPGLFLSAYEVYEKIAADTGVVFIEDLIPEVLGDKDLKSDTVHPNAEGYLVMAKTIYTELQDRGAL